MFRRLLATAAVGSALLATPVLTVAQPAAAATSSACQGGDFRAVLPSGRVLSGYTGFKIGAAELPAGSRVQIKGRYIDFALDASTFAVYDYALTGAANPFDPTGGVYTPLFASKVPNLGGKTLTSEFDIQLSPQSAVIKREGSGLKMKIQAKDCATGGIFQMEPEAGQAVTVTHTLAPGVFYFTNPYTGKINFGNGAKLIGKDSPQVAAKLSQSATASTWSIASGGRMGGVLGEDAVEASAGATNCVSDCQAQNQVQGTLTVLDPNFG